MSEKKPDLFKMDPFNPIPKPTINSSSITNPNIGSNDGFPWDVLHRGLPNHEIPSGTWNFEDINVGDLAFFGASMYPFEKMPLSGYHISCGAPPPGFSKIVPAPTWDTLIRRRPSWAPKLVGPPPAEVENAEKGTKTENEADLNPPAPVPGQENEKENDQQKEQAKTQAQKESESQEQEQGHAQAQAQSRGQKNTQAQAQSQNKGHAQAQTTQRQGKGQPQFQTQAQRQEHAQAQVLALAWVQAQRQMAQAQAQAQAQSQQQQRQVWPPPPPPPNPTPGAGVLGFPGWGPPAPRGGNSNMGGGRGTSSLQFQWLPIESVNSPPGVGIGGRGRGSPRMSPNVFSYNSRFTHGCNCANLSPWERPYCPNCDSNSPFGFGRR